ncbi:MAG: hypothetical protein HOC20_02280 [Chloroflexi bacterium]|nr:hypothetical protein [Chloroflexota bacterium]
MPKLPKIPIPSKLLELFQKIPIATVLSKIPGISKIPNPNRIPNPLKIPAIAHIPTRTKIILVVALAIVVISIPVMLSLGQTKGDDSEQETVAEEIAEEEPEAIEEVPAEPVEETVEGEVPAEPVEEQPAEEPGPAPAIPPEEGEVAPEPTPEPIVGGALIEDTTWTTNKSPYELTSTIRVPAGITLTIEPGVTVTKEQGVNIEYMFALSGTLSARGTFENPIVFDGGGNSGFFESNDPDSNPFVNLDYCRIRNGIKLWDSRGGLGAFDLRHSRVTNLSGSSDIFYPEQDIYIEYNVFKNTGGFSIEQQRNSRIYIQYNLFDGKYGNTDYWIQNRLSLNQSETIVRYNSFSPSDMIVLKLPPRHETAAIIATDNYWGTQDENLISGMIFDKNDDNSCAGYISYFPFLSEPHRDTPTM